MTSVRTARARHQDTCGLVSRQRQMVSFIARPKPPREGPEKLPTGDLGRFWEPSGVDLGLFFEAAPKSYPPCRRRIQSAFYACSTKLLLAISPTWLPRVTWERFLAVSGRLGTLLRLLLSTPRRTWDASGHSLGTPGQLLGALLALLGRTWDRLKAPVSQT